MPRICVIGTGYVGLVTGACFAELGHQVTCVDVDQAKIASLEAGVVPIYEPGLEDILHRRMRSGHFQVTTDTCLGIQRSDFIFFCVGTPSTEGNQVDLSYLHLAYMNVKLALGAARPIMVNKSTVPPGTAEMMAYLLSDLNSGKSAPAVVSNPEFLREGRAIEDFMCPSRVVIGSEDTEAAKQVAGLYRPLGAPIITTNTRTAEMIKYASNAFLATKVSFINEIAMLCEKTGVDVADVADGVGLDPRICREFLSAGLGYGGSCLPKDVGVLRQIACASEVTPKLLTSVIEVNAQQPERLVERIRSVHGGLGGADVSVLGLAFKPHTDDVRSSPAKELVERLLAAGAHVRVSDPEAWPNARKQLDGRVAFDINPYRAAEGCDIVVLATEWPEYRAIDLHRLRMAMRGDLFVDGRMAMSRLAVLGAGFRYLGVGSGTCAEPRQPVGAVSKRAIDVPLEREAG